MEETKELAIDVTYPHIDVYRTYYNGELNGYEACTHAGYVMYDTTATDIELNPDTMEEIPVMYYYTATYMPKNYNFNNFHYVAALKDSVDGTYIF